jgi:hypothetical protein
VRRAARFAIEALERRTLLSFSVSFPGGATFAQRGDAGRLAIHRRRERSVHRDQSRKPTQRRRVRQRPRGREQRQGMVQHGRRAHIRAVADHKSAGPTGTGDPSAAFDRAGNLYYCHLVSPGLGVAISKSTNGGQTWGSAVLIAASAADKPWITTGPNPADLSQDIVYVTYRRDVSEAGGTDTQIHCVRSLNGGATLSNDTIIADDSIAGIDFSTFPRPYVRNSDGRVFVVWDDETNRPSFSQIKLDSSGDGGG